MMPLPLENITKKRRVESSSSLGFTSTCTKEIDTQFQFAQKLPEVRVDNDKRSTELTIEPASKILHSKFPTSIEPGWEMEPWIQHSSIINLARFDYDGIRGLLEGRKGFLVTCGFRREKSATKEMLQILPKYFIGKKSQSKEEAAQSAINADLTLEVSGSKHDRHRDQVHQTNNATFPNDERLLSLIKLGSMGIVFAALPVASCTDPVQVVKSLLEDIQSRQRQPLKWCERILPVQTTCEMSAEAVFDSVVSLMTEYLSVSGLLGTSITYAVSYKNRGLQQEKKPVQDSGIKGLCKMSCIEAVGKAVRKATGDAELEVDLNNPDVLILIEILPFPQGKLVCSIGVIPGILCDGKPRLAIKSLTKVRKKDNLHS